MGLAFPTYSFADDLLLFGRVTEEQAAVIRETLDCFCGASGAKVSFEKEKLYISPKANHSNARRPQGEIAAQTRVVRALLLPSREHPPTAGSETEVGKVIHPDLATSVEPAFPLLMDSDNEKGVLSRGIPYYQKGWAVTGSTVGFALLSIGLTLATISSDSSSKGKRRVNSYPGNRNFSYAMSSSSYGVLCAPSDNCLFICFI
ncbi:hypothetical protein COLO4_02539 [Corchorus olitorius]|uniref:Uncharacterized protein n=1 Tax=Corchorus olitorius TaxID=93759 RepID=A0A1R3L0R7_9ROSI|nr:hypothetical protein COLO4_02539 [Corchorus olitorius]